VMILGSTSTYSGECCAKTSTAVSKTISKTNRDRERLRDRIKALSTGDGMEYLLIRGKGHASSSRRG
jgi:hypothetical protein